MGASASDDCLATVVVTIQEKTVEIKKQKVITNKWLQVEDWAALYKILERAILRNCRSQTDESHCENRGCEWKKSTRQLEVTYTFEYSECTSDVSSLPTIKVHVSPARKKSLKRETKVTKRNKVVTLENNDNTTKRTKEEKSPDQMTDPKVDQSRKTLEKSLQTSPKKIESSRAIATEQEDPKRIKKSRKYVLSNDLENAPLEEYIPDAPKAKRSCTDLNYVPSQKSALENMRLTLNEYTPTLCDSKPMTETVSYVPNSIEKLETIHETYEPRATTTIPEGILEEYVPNSKGAKPSVEKYEPGFKSSSKLMKFDDSYVPSSVQQSSNSKRMNPSKSRRKGTLLKKMDLFS
ncbi:uncharacterized protein LOC114942832 isoform X2 [Nylanderia fulva]|uniref:uncharacterized protein LOC114942832 isoform X2 n=1 Tax=Nylanderia fulva TaxID=613905 RepID=UPI0010FBBCF1|nr:uncharacterized protein LOC114942832 isoform X2 [Nylanderia fulva]